MHGQTKAIDSVRSVSPAKDRWAISFAGGLSGILDMQHPHSVVWSRLLDLHQRLNKPVYVEIDPETQRITELLIPQPSRVMSIEIQPDGDVEVLFFTSQARHYLRRGHPDFQSMLDALQQAANSALTMLVTAAREDHEIIDVRPLPKAQGAANPGPPSPPPTDPPVSMQRAQELFALMASKGCDGCNAQCSATPHCIPFMYANDGCYARAHEMCRLMMADGEAPEKVWIYGSLHVVTYNVHQCDIFWGWHVAPTLMVTNGSGPAEKYVIDPSLFDGPVTVATWQAKQNTSALLRYSTWVPFWSDWYLYPESQWDAQQISDPTFSQTDYYLELKCSYYITEDCTPYGPPPYVCPIVKNSQFILDRSTFSESEVDAMLGGGSPATVQAAFYVVLDGFAPVELGVTAASLSGVPNIQPALTLPVTLSQMQAACVSLDVQDASHLKRRQRLTWTYNVLFSGTNDFAFVGDMLAVPLSASISGVSCIATVYLLKQPNPYETDGATSWLSTDLRVFQIKAGESRFGVAMGSDAPGFITQVLTTLNGPNTSGQTFEDISTDQQTSRLELSQTVGGTPVYNFAVAKVRYRAKVVSATDVRVFFRLFPWQTTSVEYDQPTAYRRHATTTTAVPLPGLKNGRLTSIPCFGAPRVDSAAVSVTTQNDAPNLRTIPADSGGAEVARYFGCWLDFNQTQPQFPIYPSPPDGPWASGRISIYDHVRNEHQCLVAEIAFTPAPISNGVTPSTSDKLAQRSLALVPAANPGVVSSRRVPQTFEIRPSISKAEHDELMIDWGSIPSGSLATLYLPDFDANDIVLLAARKYRSHTLVSVDDHTLKFETGGISWAPIPFADGTFPGMLTVDLPDGIQKGQAFTAVVRQVSGAQTHVATRLVAASAAETLPSSARHIVGSFQLTIPVHTRTDILPGQQRLLSNLRWIERAIPASDRWAPVFRKYVAQVAARVDALGGDSRRVAPSASGQWQDAYRRCALLAAVIALLVALVVVGSGTAAAGVAMLGAVPVAVLLAAAVYFWKRQCRPTTCQVLRATMIGTAVGVVVLGLLALFGQLTPRLIAALVIFAGAAAALAVWSWVKGCFRWSPRPSES
jgi:hypothetical protein